MIDMSHANSQKQHEQQIDVCTSICEQLRNDESRIMGVMIESHLVAGSQKIGNGNDLTYGKSITDACIGWEDTESCLRSLAEAVDARGSSS